MAYPPYTDGRLLGGRSLEVRLYCPEINVKTLNHFPVKEFENKSVLKVEELQRNECPSSTNAPQKSIIC